ncbi:glycosyltransferase [Nitrosococcus oceani]|uniref:glycosyltransferase n=1 Tax=Nitrosococcus oceani TaxID=1229 RepID=UPI00068A4319|nr:glycosyltransferase [Nitrosococcus oceani]
MVNNASETIEISNQKALPKNPLVSVYMLTYKHEKLIAEAIEGVIAQQCDFPIELIIGEDCSPDRTREIVLDYQRRYPHLIRVLTAGTNIGAKANAARCRNSTRGEFVAICEGDDYWIDPSKLQRQITLISAQPRLMLVGHPAQLKCAISGKKLGVVRPTFSSRVLSMHELILGDGGLIPTASILVRRKVLNTPPEWSARAPVGDYPLVLRAGLLGDVVSLNRIMSVYRYNVPGSWSEQRSREFTTRWAHAREIDLILSGFDREAGRHYNDDVKAMISKYYSDTLIHFKGDSNIKRRHLQEIAYKLTRSDRLFCTLAVKLGMPVGTMKTFHRKVNSLARILQGERSMKHVSAPSGSHH